MAQITLQGPDQDHRGPNLGDETPERGWSFKHIVASLNAMFGELYAAVPVSDSADAAALTLRTSESDVIQGDESDYAGSHSYQPVGPDLPLSATAGKSVADGTAFLAAVMGNLLGAALTKTGNYLGGLIGLYSVTGAKATHYPAGALLAGIGDGVTEADGAVVAFIDGDSAQTNAGAAFKVRNNNSTAASGFDYGLDLQDAAHDGFQAVDAAFYKKAPLRLVTDVVVLVGAGVPSNGTTGAAVAGSGSLYVDVTNANLYINANTKASPTWKLVTRAA